MTGITATAPPTVTAGTAFNVTVASTGYNSTPVKVQRWNSGWTDVAGATGTTDSGGAATISTTINPPPGPALLRVVDVAGTTASPGFNTQVLAPAVPTVAVTAPRSVTAGTAFSVPGFSTGLATSTPMQGQYLSGGTWTNLGSTANTGSDGTFTLALTLPGAGAFAVRAVVAATGVPSDADLVTAVAAATIVASGPTTAAATTAFTVSGAATGLPVGTAVKVQTLISSTWTDLSGATGTMRADGSFTLSATVATATGATSVRVVSTSPAATSAPFTTTVGAGPTPGITVTAPTPGSSEVTGVAFNVVGTTVGLADATPVTVQQLVGGAWTTAASGTVSSNAFTVSTTVTAVGSQVLRVIAGSARSNSVGVTVTAAPRADIALGAPRSATAGTAFTLTGTTTNIANSTAVKAQQLVGGVWTDVAGATGTVSGGAFTLSVTQATAATVTLRAVTTSPAAASNAVNVMVLGAAALAAGAPGSVPMGVAFAVSGTSTGLPGGTAVKVQTLISSTWTDLSGATGTTHADGTYSIAATVASAGAQQVRVVSTSPAATSNVVPVTVTGAASISASAPASAGSGNAFAVTGTSVGLADTTPVKVQRWNGGWVDVSGATATVTSNAFTISTTVTPQGPALLRVATANGGTVSGDFTVGIGVAAAISATVPATATAGVSFNVVVASVSLPAGTALKVQDWTTGSGVDVSGATGTTASDGSATIATTLTTAGARQLKVVSTAPAVASATGTVTVSATIAATVPATGTNGSPFNVTITSAGLPTGTAVKVQDWTTGSGVDVSGATSTTASNGTATISTTLTTNGARQLKVVSTSPAATSNTGTITIS